LRSFHYRKLLAKERIIAHQMVDSLIKELKTII
jgi:hypothetical protein